MPYQRRAGTLITALTMLTLSAALLFSGLAQAAEITLKFADQFPLTHHASIESSQFFIKRVHQLSDGRIQIKHYPAQQLAKARGLLKAAKLGITDIANIGVVYMSDKIPLSGAALIPGIFTDFQKGNDAYEKLVKTQLATLEFAPNKVRPLYSHLGPIYQIQLISPKPITSLDQLKGLKLRVPGPTIALSVQALGAIPVTMPATDIYLSLSRGTLDGVILSNISWHGYGLQELLNSTTTNASMGTVAFATVINERKWQKLPEWARVIITRASEETRQNAVHTFATLVDKIDAQLIQEGINVYPLSEELRQQIQQKILPVENEWAARLEKKGLPARETLINFRALVNE